jgi:hypothetical protein
MLYRVPSYCCHTAKELFWKKLKGERLGKSECELTIFDKYCINMLNMLYLFVKYVD